MSSSFENAMAFAVVMALRDADREREAQRQKERNFYQTCYEEISGSFSEVSDLITRMVNATTLYVPPELTNGLCFYPLYCCGVVLRRNGRITKEQRYFLSFYFRGMNYPFTQKQYEHTMLRGGKLEEFDDIMVLSSTQLGDFWLALMHLISKAGTRTDFQQIVDAAINSILRFSVLGDPRNQNGLPLCTAFVDNINTQFRTSVRIPPRSLDWMGIVPIADRIEDMHKIYHSLQRKSGFDLDDPNDPRDFLFDCLFQHCVTDIAMLTGQPKEKKMRMINSAMQYINVHPVIDTRQYVRSLALRTGTYYDYASMYSFTPVFGKFWHVFIVMVDQTGSEKDGIRFCTDLFAILAQVEWYWTQKFGLPTDLQLARRYFVFITEAQQKHIQEERSKP